MEEPRANAVLVLLVGIPASGKSSLAEQYMRSESEIAGLEATVHVVSYDDLFDELASGSIAAAEADVAEDGAVFDPATWHDSRREALGRATALLQEPPVAGKERSRGGAQKQSKKRAESALSGGAERSGDGGGGGNGRRRVTVVVLDDTFHYKSMRREARKVARTSNAGLVIVHVDVPLDVCLLRNAHRLPLHRRVPEHSLRRIHATLEPPGTRGGREGNEASSGGDGGGDGGSGGGNSGNSEREATSRFDGSAGTATNVQKGLPLAPELREEGATVVVVRSTDLLQSPPQHLSDTTSRIWAAVATAHALPALESEEDIAAAATAAAESRAITDKSILHAADLALRKVLSSTMAAVQASQEGNRMQASASLDSNLPSAATTLPNPTPPVVTTALTPEAVAATQAAMPLPQIESRRLAQMFNYQRRLLLEEFRRGTLACGTPVTQNGGNHDGPDVFGYGDVLTRAYLRRMAAELRRVTITESLDTSAIQEKLLLLLGTSSGLPESLAVDEAC